MKTMLLERVLIPLDGTPAAESVVPLLEPILRRSGSEVFLVRALPPGDPNPRWPRPTSISGSSPTASRAKASAPTRSSEEAPLPRSSRVLAWTRSFPDRDVRPRGRGAARDGAPAPGKREARARVPPADAGRSFPKEPPDVLAPLDGSEASRRSLPLALELAGILEARVILMRVIERDDEEMEALHDLDEVAHRLALQGLTAEIWIERGEPAEKILQVSRDEEARLIVLTTRGGSGGPDDALGPVATEVMNRSAVPVLAVHARGA